MIEEKKWDNTPEDELRHDVTDELAAYKLASLPFPGVFGVFYEAIARRRTRWRKSGSTRRERRLGNAVRSRNSSRKPSIE